MQSQTHTSRSLSLSLAAMVVTELVRTYNGKVLLSVHVVMCHLVACGTFGPSVQ
jgi:hypothetical protein